MRKLLRAHDKLHSVPALERDDARRGCAHVHLSTGSDRCTQQLTTEFVRATIAKQRACSLTFKKKSQKQLNAAGSRLEQSKAMMRFVRS